MSSLHSNYKLTPLAWSSLLCSLSESVRQRVQRDRDVEEFKTTFFDQIDNFLEIILCNGYLQPYDIHHIVNLSQQSIERSFPSVETLIEPTSTRLDTVIEGLIRRLWRQRDINSQLEIHLKKQYRTYCDIVQIINAAKITNKEGVLYHMEEQIATLQQEVLNLRLSRETFINSRKLNLFLHQVSQFKAASIRAQTCLKKLSSRIESLTQLFSSATVSTAVDIDN